MAEEPCVGFRIEQNAGDEEPRQDEKQIDAWHAFCDLLGFQADRFEDCLSGRDSFLDEVEITLEAWKNNYGL